MYYHLVYAIKVAHIVSLDPNMMFHKLITCAYSTLTRTLYRLIDKVEYNIRTKMARIYCRSFATLDLTWCEEQRTYRKTYKNELIKNK